MRAAFAAFGLVLVPFGPVSKLGSGPEPFRGAQFGVDSKDAVALIARVQSVPLPRGDSCQQWIDALKSLDYGSEIGTKPRPQAWQASWKAWAPWVDEDNEAVSDCQDFPCKVKLDRAEVDQMKAVSKDGRKAKFLELVTQRSERYASTQVRKEYEYSGDPVDPWALLEKAGFVSPLPKTTQPELWVRSLAMAPGKMRTIRQVVDRRYVAGKFTATLWIRDAYTAHYFDSWGEWHHVSCDVTARKAQVVQALLLELDLLKDGDLFAQLGRGKMRSAVEENGQKYLDARFQAVKKHAR